MYKLFDLHWSGELNMLNNILDKTAELTGKATRKLVTLSNKVASKSVPVTQRLATNFAKGYNNPQVVLPKNTTGEVGICNICEGPYVDGHCMEYKCWK